MPLARCPERMHVMSPTSVADLLLTDLDVYCNDDSRSCGREIAVKDGQILAVGDLRR